MNEQLQQLHPAAVDAGKFLLSNCLRQPVRPYAQFAEDEIILPRGPYRGHRFRVRRFPASGLWFAELDARRWQYHVATGPTQSGKTLCCFIIPILYCLFERGEDVIVGLPHLDMADDKWGKDLFPAITKTRYAKLLPRSGEGSKGGKVRSVRFSNGCTLTFMSFGGDDKSRAGETAPNIIITETDGGSEPASTSVEDSPIGQLVARSGAFDLDAFIVMECTVSTVKGETWQRYVNGSKSRIVRPCPRCSHWVTPERQHFKSWQGAENEIDAGELGRWHCPACDEPWTDDQRHQANQASVLMHRGQEVTPEGQVVGRLPKTDTLGFRWSAIDNQFRSSTNLARMEFKATRAVDQELAQKNLLQFQYAVPWEDEAAEDDGIDPYAAATRCPRLPPPDLLAGFHAGTPQGVVPAGTEVLTMGADLRKRELHWSVWAWLLNGTCRVIDYDVVKVFSDRLGTEQAIMAACRYLRDQVVTPGWQVEGTSERLQPDQVWIDAGWKPNQVYAFMVECDASQNWQGLFRPTVGRGAGRQYKKRYQHKARTSKGTPYVGEGFYFSLQASHDPPLLLVIVNADEWKSFVHARFNTPTRTDQDDVQPGAATLFSLRGGDHLEFCRHLAAEYPQRQFVQGVGEVTVWQTVSRVNHYFDTSYLAAAAASFCGVKVATSDLPPAPPPDEPAAPDNLTTPDGRQFYE